MQYEHGTQTALKACVIANLRLDDSMTDLYPSIGNVLTLMAPANDGLQVCTTQA